LSAADINQLVDAGILSLSDGEKLLTKLRGNR
jgi:hypothetical protein